MGTSTVGNFISQSMFGGQFSMLHGTALKSTQEKMERQQKANNQIAFWENQKANLKNMECDSVEEIAKKLEMFHTYENEIAAAKAAYNQEQVFHVLDEAREKGEKIAEAAEKAKLKTPEERKKEILEEIREDITGTEESDGILEEILEDAEELMEKMQEKQMEEIAEDALIDSPEELAEAEQLQNYRPFDCKA